MRKHFEIFQKRISVDVIKCVIVFPNVEIFHNIKNGRHVSLSKCTLEMPLEEITVIMLKIETGVSLVLILLNKNYAN